MLLLGDDHSSPVLEWLTRAEAADLRIDIVARPEDGDWTAALLAAIARPGVAPPALASISSIHWSDGGAVDLDRVGPALRACGAALLVDATHAAGVTPLDVRALDPDFLVFPTYKWVLGPYGRAFLYVARRHQDGIPLEQTAYGRRGVGAEQATYLADTGFVAGARRFDMGERDHFISLEMAAIGMEMVADVGGRSDHGAAGLAHVPPRGRARRPRRHGGGRAGAGAAYPERCLPAWDAGGAWLTGLRPRMCTWRRGSAAYGSAPMCTMTRRTSIVSWRYSVGSCLNGNRREEARPKSAPPRPPLLHAHRRPQGRADLPMQHQVGQRIELGLLPVQDRQLRPVALGQPGNPAAG